MSIQNKFLLTLIFPIIIFILIAVASVSIERTAEYQQQIKDQIQQQSRELINTLSITDNLLMQQVKSSMKLLLQRINNAGTVSTGEPTQVKDLQVPDLLIGEKPQANQFELVDSVTAIMGGTATLFSKQGQDFVRISTNVQTENGRATGTILSQGGAAIKMINQGQAYYGAVDILGNPYVTGYEPLRNNSGSTIGIAYVGYKADLAALNELIANSRIMQQGFIALYDRNRTLRAYSSHITEQNITTALSEPNDWDVTTTPFPAWGYEVVLAYPKQELNAIINQKVLSSGIAILVGALFLLALLYFLIQRIVIKRVDETVQALKAVTEGDGDLSRRFQTYAKDEFGDLAKGFDKLLGQLHDTVQQLTAMSNTLVSSASDLSGLATSSLHSVDVFKHEIDETSHAVQSLANIASNVSGNASFADQTSAEVATLTSQAQQALDNALKNAEQQLNDVAKSATSISELAEASAKIGSVLDVINTIADQTNLLALNAAIEAARAGEQGRGFSVVADEVRLLAGRTQSSTEEIKRMIEHLQLGVHQVQEGNGRYQLTVTKNAEETTAASEALKQALVATRKISVTNKEINELATQQNSVIHKIERQAATMRAMADQSNNDASSTDNASQALSQLAKQFNNVLAKYRL